MDLQQEHLSERIQSIVRPRPGLARRAFFVGSLRSAMVAGVAAVSAVLTLRTARSPGAECRRQTACRGCPEWGGCTLPAAVAAKAVRPGKEHAT